MLSMHDVIFILGFTNIVRRNAAVDPRISRMSVSLPPFFLSLRKQLLYKLDIYHKIFAATQWLAVKKLYYFLIHMWFLNQSNKWLRHSRLERKSPIEKYPHQFFPITLKSAVRVIDILIQLFLLFNFPSQLTSSMLFHRFGPWI